MDIVAKKYRDDFDAKSLGVGFISPILFIRSEDAMRIIVRGFFVAGLLLSAAMTMQTASADPTEGPFLYKKADAPIEQRVATFFPA